MKSKDCKLGQSVFLRNLDPTDIYFHGIITNITKGFIGSNITVMFGDGKSYIMPSSSIEVYKSQEVM